jgi:hypothetical protein
MVKNMENKKSYYAIIPASVRYDKRVTPMARLLYGEITALCNEKGYCWAFNEYFADQYDCSTRSITKWIKQLTDCGYIQTQLKYRDGTKQVERRYIRCVPASVGGEEMFSTPRTNVHDPIEENFNTPPNESSRLILQPNNTNNTTVVSKRPTAEEVQQYCNDRANGIDGQYFVDFYSTRGWKTNKGVTVSDWQACIRTWERGDKLKAQKDLADAGSSIRNRDILSDAQDRSWAL